MEEGLPQTRQIDAVNEVIAHGSWPRTIYLPLVSMDTNTTHQKTCLQLKKEVYSTFFSVTLAVPELEALLTSLMLCFIIVLTIVGNILVILSVFTYKPLRIAQNFFIVSLAVADLAVALLVLPLNVAYSILGRWEFGFYLCKLWLTFDVMCCTSSILNICAIALDRFWAITDPINYVYKRTVSRVISLIAGVWILSFIISSPPLFGWNDWPNNFTSTTPCELTSNRGYVIYSALGSFFIPLFILNFVYIKIYIATKRRLRERRMPENVQNHVLNKLNDNLEELEISVHKNSVSLWCSRFLCCPQKSRQMMVSTIDCEKHSCSSDVKNNEICIAFFKTNTFQTKEIGKVKSSEEQDPVGNLENVPLNIKEVGCSDNHKVSHQHILLLSSNVTEDDGTPKYDEKSSKRTFSEEERSINYVHIRKECTRIHQFIEERQKISLAKERRAARTLGIIMGAFVICWLPFFLMYIILPFCRTCCLTQKSKNFITWLGYINSSLNPLIYTIFNLDYRRSFKILLGLK